MVGGNVNSGAPNTGEVPMTRGGQFVAALYSGNVVSGGNLVSIVNLLGVKTAGSDVMLVSGAGRLNTIMPYTNAPGTAVTIYDAADVASGGPFVTSGHRPLAIVPGWPQNGAISGAGPFPIPVDMPFSSGLCIALKSGVNLFSLSYTVETNPSNPNAV